MSKQNTKQGILSSLEDYLSYLNQTNTVNTIEKNSAASARNLKDKS
jgi:hypothetical protein